MTLCYPKDKSAPPIVSIELSSFFARHVCNLIYHQIIHRVSFSTNESDNQVKKFSARNTNW